MIDRKTKRRTDLSLGPLDLASTYTDSTFNAGSVNLRDLISGNDLGGTFSALDVPIFHPGSLGARTTPGEGGFAYADTPQSTVFIQKKQWVEQEFTYLTDSSIERSGKQEEIVTRLALGRLISRKLDQLNDHELMTKLNELSVSKVGKSAIDSILSNSLNNTFGGSNQVSNFNREAVQELLASSFTGSPVTRYYVENQIFEKPTDDISSEETREVLNKEIFKLEVATTATVKGVDTRLLIRRTDDKITRIVDGQEKIIHDNVIGGLRNGAVVPILTVSENVKLFNKFANVNSASPEALSREDVELIKNNYVAINLDKVNPADLKMTGIAQPSYIKTPDQMKSYASLVTSDESSLKGTRYAFVSRTLLDIKYEPRDFTIETKSQVKINKTSTNSEDLPESKYNQFNGVMELANVTSITTANDNKSVANKATIRLENPNNLLYISADDIEIALEEVDVADEFRTGDEENGTNLELVDPTTNTTRTLTFHEGRYYTQRGYELVSSSDFDASANSVKRDVEDPSKALEVHAKVLGFHIDNAQSYKSTGSVNKSIIESLRVNYQSGTVPDLKSQHNKIKAISEVPKAGITITSFPSFEGRIDEGNETFDPYFLSNRDKVQSHIDRLKARLRLVRTALTHAKRYGLSDKTDKDNKDPKLIYRRAQLRKYFQNRTIFEVYDRVYIWMSSPSRTNFRLADGTIVSEAPNFDSQQQIILQRIQEIISLLRQLDSTIQNLGNQLSGEVTTAFIESNQTSIPQQFPNPVLERINKELFDKGSSITLDSILTDHQSPTQPREIKETKQEREQAIEDRETADKAAIDAEKDKKQIEEKLAIKQNEVESQQQSLQISTTEVEAQQQVVSDLESEIAVARIDQANAVSEIDKAAYQVGIEGLEEELSQARLELNQLNNNLEIDQHLLDTLNNEVEELKDQLEDAKGNIVDTKKTATKALQEERAAGVSLEESRLGGIEGAFKNDPTIRSLISTISVKKDTLKELFESKPNQDLARKSGSNAVPGTTTSFQGVSNSALQGLDPAQLLNPNSTAGLAEDQIQVFQGVITGIDRAQKDGNFTITLTCEDNLNFLQRSRYIEVPAIDVPSRGERRFLDDPIWRKTEKEKGRDAELVKGAEEKSEIGDLAGRWKTGILTLSSQIIQGKDESKEAENDSKTGRQNPGFITELQRRSITRVASQFFNEPFLGADPATIVSLLVTGKPFDVSQYLRNTNSIAALLPATDDKGKRKQDELVRESSFEQIKREIDEQGKKFGDFNPIIDLAGLKITPEDKREINLNSALNLATSIVNFVQDYVFDRASLFPDIDKQILQQEQDRSGIYFKVTKEKGSVGYISDVFSNDGSTFNEDVIETTNETLKIVSLGDPRINFLIQCAINGISTAQLNTLLKTLTTAEQDVPRFQGFVPDVKSTTVESFHQVSNSDQIYLLSNSEKAAYDQIFQIVRARITRGVVFSLIFDSKGQESDKDASTSDGTTTKDVLEKKRIAAIQGLTLNEDATQIIDGNPLQTTKASIAFKQKTNHLVVSGDYFSSPNLIDYVEQLLPNPQQYQQDVWKTVVERCKKSAETIDWEFYADTQGNIRFKPPTYNRTLLRHLLDVEKLDSYTRSDISDILARSGAKEPSKLLTYRKYQNVSLKLKDQALKIVEKLIQEALTLPVSDSFSFGIFEGGQFSPNIDGFTNLLGIPGSTNILGLMLSNKVTGFDKSRFNQINALLKLPLNSQVTKIDSKNPKVITPSPLSMLKIIEEEADLAFEATSLTIDTNGGEAKKAMEKAFGDSAFQEHRDKVKEYSLFLEKNKFDLVDDLKNIFNADTKEEDLAQQLGEATVKAIEIAVSIAIYCTKLNKDLEQKIAGLEGQLATSLQNLTDQQFIHVIPNAIILSENYQEHFPEYTRLDVNSVIPQLGTYQGQIQRDAIQWAGSVDYDLWRNYGFMQSDTKIVPFLRSATQAVLYAHMLMSRQYSKILQGNVTVRGDSKYQPGDTVYIEDENMYYYVTGVSHSFTFGQDYTTSLELTYGRRPGHYIPYPFDVLGSTIQNATQEGIYQTNGDPRTLIDSFNKAEQERNNQ